MNHAKWNDPRGPQYDSDTSNVMETIQTRVLNAKQVICTGPRPMLARRWPSAQLPSAVAEVVWGHESGALHRRVGRGDFGADCAQTGGKGAVILFVDIDINRAENEAAFAAFISAKPMRWWHDQAAPLRSLILDLLFVVDGECGGVARFGRRKCRL
jgi:hypothetical protein